MRVDGLDLNLLIALSVLLEEKSVSRAARRLHLTQSTVSGVLSRLREHFKDELLVPAGRKMTITAAAELLAQPVRQILGEAQALTLLTSCFDPARSTRRLRIMCTDFAANVLMVGTLALIRRQAPGVTVELMQPSLDPVKSLEKNVVDLLILPNGMRSRTHPCEIVMSDEYRCLVCATNDTLGDEITLQQFMSMRHVICRFGMGRVSYFDQHFASHYDAQRHIDVIAPSFELLPRLVQGTDRIATLPRSLAKDYARQWPLRLVTPLFAAPTLQLVAQWNEFREQDLSLRWLRSLIKQVADHQLG